MSRLRLGVILGNDLCCCLDGMFSKGILKTQTRWTCEMNPMHMWNIHSVSLGGVYDFTRSQQLESNENDSSSISSRSHDVRIVKRIIMYFEFAAFGIVLC